MDSHTNIVIIGAGAMGSAILRGWIYSSEVPADVLRAHNFTVVDPNADKNLALAKEFEGLTTKDARTASDLLGAFDTVPDIVLLAVKPQIIDDVMADLADLCWFKTAERTPLVVSIAAGVPTSRIEAALGGNVHVVRVMPNLPLQVSLGASVVAKGSVATDDEAELVRDLFAALGFASLVDEEQIDVACAISGGGPAYVAKMIEDLTQAGVENGLPEDLAVQLATTTVGGSYKLLVEEDITPQDLRVRVCSPGGTTLAALAAMDDVGFTRSITAGIDAAINRAKELAQ